MFVTRRRERRRCTPKKGPEDDPRTALSLSLFTLASAGCSLRTEDALSGVPADPGSETTEREASSLEIIDGQLVLEGDIILGPAEDGATVEDALALDEQSAGLFDMSRGYQGASAYFGAGQAWPNGIVYYKFNANVSPTKRTAFTSAAQHWRDNTTVRVLPAPAGVTSYVEVRGDLTCQGNEPAGMPDDVFVRNRADNAIYQRTLTSSSLGSFAKRSGAVSW